MSRGPRHVRRPGRLALTRPVGFASSRRRKFALVDVIRPQDIPELFQERVIMVTGFSKRQRPPHCTTKLCYFRYLDIPSVPRTPINAAWVYDGGRGWARF